MSQVTSLYLQVCSYDGMLLGDLIKEAFRKSQDDPSLESNPILKDMSAHSGGPKHPQVCMFGAGLNYFDESQVKKFWSMLLDLEWHKPGRVIMVTQCELDDKAIVWRMS